MRLSSAFSFRYLYKTVNMLKTEGFVKTFRAIKKIIIPNARTISNKEDILQFIENFISRKNGRPKVFIFQPAFYDIRGETCHFGGTERYMLDLTHLLQTSLNYDCLLIQMGNQFWEKTHQWLKIIAAPTNHNFSEFLYFVNLLQEKADICIYSPFSIFSTNKKTKNVSVGISHGIYWDDDRQIYPNFFTSLAKSIKNLNYFVSVDTATINFFRGYLGYQKLPYIKYIPNYIDLNDFYPRKPATTPKPSINILFPRRVCAERGFDFLPTIFPALFEKYPHLTLTIVGSTADAAYSQKIEVFINAFPQKITHSSSSNNKMLEFYHHADIVIIPTLFAEGTSLSCLEAMACQKAIICTQVGGLTDLVIHEYNGLLVEANATALSDALCLLIENTELREKLAANAFAVAQSFAKSKWLESWERILVELKKAPHAPSS